MLKFENKKAFFQTPLNTDINVLFFHLFNLVQEQDWESGSEMEAETWYPTNMEELVTVDEVGEDDLIMEPDITELEEIVTVGQKQKVCNEGNPVAVAVLEVKNEQNLLNTNENKLNEIEACLRSEEETAGTLSDSEGNDGTTKASHLNTDTEQKPDKLHEGRPLRDSDYHDTERKINENTDDVHLMVEEPPKELLQLSDRFVDNDKEVASLESKNRTAMEVLVKSSQEETSCGNQEHEKSQGNCLFSPSLLLENFWKQCIMNLVLMHHFIRINFTQSRNCNCNKLQVL